MKATAWLAGSLERLFPGMKAGGARTLIVPSARGARVSFQAAISVSGEDAVTVSAEVASRSGLGLRVRRVGCVPVPHHNTKTPLDELDGRGCIPGYVPDILYDESEARVAPNEVTAFWVTVTVPTDIKSGRKSVVVTLKVNGKRAAGLTATIAVSAVILKPRRDFHVTHWFYADAISDWYGVKPFSPAFWPICRKYMANYAEHGLDMIYVPVFTPPLDGVKRPTQLLRVRRTGKGKYGFDWKLVKRWIVEARRAGLKFFEWTHFFTQWGAKNAIRVYEGDPEDEKLLWPPATGATSKTYRAFLAQLLPALEKFLRREKLMSASYFHVSDEPHGPEHRANYTAARAMLRELAPWMRVMDALSEIEFGREGLVDIPIPSIKVTRQFAEEGIPSWTYFCCGPRGRFLNRLLDTPLAKQRMAGWLFYRFGVGGFLHWGFNYWYQRQTRRLIDPFTVTDGLNWPGWAYGDTFQVYPGPDGPLDSIRCEVFAESLQDYALLQTLEVNPKGTMLRALRDFDDYPKDGRWLSRRLKQLLRV